jgi:hypothetical protein
MLTVSTSFIIVVSCRYKSKSISQKKGAKCISDIVSGHTVVDTVHQRIICFGLGSSVKE